MVYVTSAEDISTTILFCRAHKIEIAVSGGKHASSGAGSTDGGLVIDLSKMRQVTVNTKDNTVAVQGGAVWKDVDEAAGEYGLAAVGGTVNHTGVGGLTLGGGYGWLSGQYGLTVDNLLKVVMVLADGSIVKASEKENPDLFWAVRGAGQCFGVAVEFTFQAHEQKDPVWAGQMIFPAEEKMDAIVNFANHVAEASQGNSGMIMGLTAPPFLKGPAIITTVFYNGPTEEAEEFFAPLLRLGPIKNTVIERPYCTVNGMMNHAVAYGGRKLSKGACFVTPIRPDFVRSILEDLKLLHQEIPETKKTILLMEFFKSAKWCDVDKKSMAFANRGEHQNAMIGPFWEDLKNDTACRLWARQVAAKYVVELDRMKEQRGYPASMEEIGEYGNYDCERLPSGRAWLGTLLICDLRPFCTSAQNFRHQP